jgi:3-hydroxyisobutyrate dehydrogenase-like beta-hydroxyacid dehydrogenase
MSTTGFIGLGVMGLPMARNVVNAGFDVIGANRSPARTERLRAQGGGSLDHSALLLQIELVSDRLGEPRLAAGGAR